MTDLEKFMALSPGFVPSEAQVLLEMAQQAYSNAPSAPTCGVPPVPAPSGWTVVTSLTPTTATLLDNYWQVWQNQNNPLQYAIAIRGTIDTDVSALADLLFPLINARIDFKLDGIQLAFNLAQDEGNSPVKAGVHSGFALSLLLMLFTTDSPLFSTLVQLALTGGSEVYITGHSQGASIATLLTSLVRHSTQFFAGPSYKTYTFAPAKPGNDHYAYDYDQLAGIIGYGWAVVSTQDWVPQLPLTLESLRTINTPNPLFKFGGALSALPASSVTPWTAANEAEIQAARAAAAARLRLRVDELAARLEAETIHLNKRDLGGTADPVTGSSIADLIEQIPDEIQDSLNFAKAGALVPLFATPGGNPTDGTSNCQPFDAFWQHHLGNYLKYLNAQYQS